jgi:hypothetical protein
MGDANMDFLAAKNQCVTAPQSSWQEPKPGNKKA